MKTARETGLDAAVMKWYVQERSVGINVRGVEIMSAANRLAVLGNPLPLLLTVASTQYWAAYSINLGLAFLMSETVCLATPYSSHSFATLVPFSNFRISSSLAATGRAFRLRFTGLRGLGGILDRLSTRGKGTNA